MLVKLMLDELKVKCAAEECGEVMQRGLLLGHSRGCQKVVVGCGNADCGLTVGLSTRLTLARRDRRGYGRTMELSADPLDEEGEVGSSSCL